MKGNIYICLNEETYNSNLPSIFDRYKRAEYDDEGNLVQLLPTTFAQMGEDNKVLFGDVVTFEKDGNNFYVLEFSASWLDGEVSYLLSLGDGLAYPNNTLLNNAEVGQLISENTDTYI